jgi:DNA-binding response OmpR family regulator
MVGKHPIIFLVEDCADTALVIERGVMQEMPDVRILWARNMAEATARTAGLPIDLFLVDIGLPDGNGLDFLWLMATEHPNARAIVMTAFPLPEHRAHSEALGVLHFLEKPVQFRPIIDHLRAALDQAAEDPGEGNDFRATLHNVTPADILQFKCLTGATTVVEFLSGGNVGWIRFEEGQITDAAAGSWRGVEAVYEIIGWKTGQVSERPCVGLFERTIHTPWHSLLMDAAHRLDERGIIPSR